MPNGRLPRVNLFARRQVRKVQTRTDDRASCPVQRVQRTLLNDFGDGRRQRDLITLSGRRSPGTPSCTVSSRHLRPRIRDNLSS